MAVLNVYTIRDVRTEAYGRPMFVQNDMVLERSLLDALNDPDHPFSSHSNDYQVFRLGTYDDNTGKFDVHAPEHMYNVFELKEVK